jgi:hypothetical protein
MMDRACSMDGEPKRAYRTLVGKPEKKRPLGGHRYRLKDNNKIDVRDIEWAAMAGNHLAQDRNQRPALVNTIMNFCFHKILGNYLVPERLIIS